jgi:hypothetical protein
MENEIHKSVSSLLKNISDGLSILSIDELSKAISDIVIKKKSNVGDLDKLYQIVCVQYDVSKKSLSEKYSRGNIYYAKITLWTIMNKHLGISKRKIASMFETYPNAVNVAIAYFDKLNPQKFKADDTFLSKYQLCLNNFYQQIN